MSTGSPETKDGEGEGGGREETAMTVEMPGALSHKALSRAFVLDSNSEWVTVATGVTVTEQFEDGNSLTVSLHEEHDLVTVLFSTCFQKTQEITRQQATVVTWTSIDGSDVALSFESVEGCDDFWVDICTFLGRPTEYTPQDEEPGRSEMEGAGSRARRGAEGEEDEEEQEGEGEGEHSEGQESRGEMQDERRRLDSFANIRILPEQVEFETIPEVEQALLATINAPPSMQSAMAAVILERSFIPKLLDLFRIAEDLGSTEIILRLHSVLQSLVLLNNLPLLQEMLSTESIVHVAGIFEYNPSFRDERPAYRRFLLDQSRFKKVLDIQNQALLDLIHQTFRAQYFKDVILPSVLDYETCTSLLYLIRSNCAEIIDFIESDTEYMSKLISLFWSEDEDSRWSILKFMKELLFMYKVYTNKRRPKFYEDLFFPQFLQFLEQAISTADVACQSLATELLSTVVRHDPTLVRECAVRANTRALGAQLLTTIIGRITALATPCGMRWQLSAVLRSLADTAGPFGASHANDEFLDFLYPDYTLRVLEPLVELEKTRKSQTLASPSSPHPPMQMSAGEVDLYFNVSEILCSFIVQHKYRIKYLLFRTFVIQNSLVLLHSSDNALKMCAVRIVRKMIGTGDDFYFRFFIKQLLFKPIIEEAIALNTSDNALSSAIIELFCFIKEKRYRLLITHFIDVYKGELEKIKIYPIYRELLSSYTDLYQCAVDEGDDDALQEGGGQHKSTGYPSRDTWSGLDQSEEAYFNTSNDYEDEYDLLPPPADTSTKTEDPASAGASPSSDMTDGDEGGEKGERIDGAGMPSEKGVAWVAEDLAQPKRSKY